MVTVAWTIGGGGVLNGRGMRIGVGGRRRSGGGHVGGVERVRKHDGWNRGIVAPSDRGVFHSFIHSFTLAGHQASSSNRLGRRERQTGQTGRRD